MNMKRKRKTRLHQLAWIPLVFAGAVSGCDVSALDGDPEESSAGKSEATNLWVASPTEPTQMDQDGSGVLESSVEPNPSPPSRERPLQPDEDGYSAQPTSAPTPTTTQENVRTR